MQEHLANEGANCSVEPPRKRQKNAENGSLGSQETENGLWPEAVEPQSNNNAEATQVTEPFVAANLPGSGGTGRLHSTGSFNEDADGIQQCPNLEHFIAHSSPPPSNPPLLPSTAHQMQDNALCGVSSYDIPATGFTTYARDIEALLSEEDRIALGLDGN